MAKLGDRIREAREACGLTQQQLAQRVGTTQGQITRWEASDNMGTSNLINLAKALNISVDKLLTGVWPAAQACRRCKRLLVPGESLRLGNHPDAPRFCVDCVKTHTEDCLRIKEEALK